MKPMLFSMLVPAVYKWVKECDTYDQCIAKLKELYDKPVNQIYARHLLWLRKQRETESIEQYLAELRHLSTECQFAEVSADQHRNEALLNVFIMGISSNFIRQRLL